MLTLLRLHAFPRTLRSYKTEYEVKLEVSGCAQLDEGMLWKLMEFGPNLVISVGVIFIVLLEKTGTPARILEFTYIFP